MTPRKERAPRGRRPRTQSNLATQPLQVSGDESEAPFVAPPVRKNTDLNLSVLKRYNPAIETILSIASSAVIYNYLPDEKTWEKAEIDGTLFVCQLETSQVSGKEGYCVVVLNKRGLDNLIVEMEDVRDVEITTEFLILIWGELGKEKTQGIYIHADKENTRVLNSRLIKECWEKAAGKGDGNGEVSSYREEVFT